jgi:hypothetical protein
VRQPRSLGSREKTARRSLTLAVLKEMLVVSSVLKNRDRKGAARNWYFL